MLETRVDHIGLYRVSIHGELHKFVGAHKNGASLIVKESVMSSFVQLAVLAPSSCNMMHAT